MKVRSQSEVREARDDIPGANQHELMLELCRTIDDASGRIVSAIGDLEAQLDRLTRSIDNLEGKL